MAARYVPYTVMAGRLFHSDHQSQPEQTVDSLLTVYGMLGNSKVGTMEELNVAVHASLDSEGSVTPWIAENLLDEVMGIRGVAGN